MVAVSIVLAAVAVVLFTFWFLKQEKIRRNADKLGGPKSLPLLGNVHQLKRNPKDFTLQLFEMVDQYSYLPAFRLLVGNHPLILATSPEEAEVNLSFFVSSLHLDFTKQLLDVSEFGHLPAVAIVIGGHVFVAVTSPEEAEPLMNSSKHMDKSSDYNFLHPWLATGLLTSTGDKWKIRRKLLTPTFHFKILHDFVGVFNDQSKILLEKLMKHADGKTTVDVFNDITLCALDIICETAMGRSVNAQKDSNSEYVQAVYKASEYTFLRQRTPWFWPQFLFNLLGPGKDYERCLSVLHSFTEKVIRERQADFAKQYDSKITMQELLDEQDIGSFLGKRKRLAFLDMLLCATTESQRLSFSDIREEVDTFMFEGHDTTAMASNWALHLIGCDPEIQQKVHNEMDAIFGESDRDATMEDLKEMKYLECCIKEALRIFPSVPVFGRSLTEDTKIAGVEFPKGTSALILPAAIHRKKHIYPDPEKFDPDRFLPENCVDRHPYAYIPFSAGARNCIGQKFAILEEKVILSTILRNFSVKSMQEREELCPLAELILRPGAGIKVVLTRRNMETMI